jgi:NitT/TauT family transport system substrate-binding protein/putative hydroxymethylpyrimidine transport system substrate-binding protein
MPARRLLPLLLALVVLTGCGDDEREPAAPRALSVALDFTPNAVHAPLYMAADAGSGGLDVQIRQPGEGPDALKLLAAGKVDVGIIDIHDLAIARRNGADAVGIGALVQRPLAALVGNPNLKRPRDLEGRTVGVSGLPSDPAFLKAIVEADGGDYDAIRQVTIGFAAVASLLSEKVDAVPVFWPAEGVALRERGRRTSEFRVERYGAPPYPEVLFMATARTVRERPELLRAFLAAVADGVRRTQADPTRATRLIAEAASADRELVRAQVDAMTPLFSPPVRLDRRVLERWADFDVRIGLLDRRPEVGRTFAFDLAPEG